MSSAALGQGSAVLTEANYIDGSDGRLFVTKFQPRAQPDTRHAVLCLPPFAEEMNKSRRMLALQGRLLANHGRMFVLPDVAGTGDSEREFGDVPWNAWCDDIRSVIKWIQALGVDRIDFLAVRSGVFLGAGIFSMAPCRVVLWNPVVRGSTMLDQMFRTILIRNLGSEKRTSVTEIRDNLSQAGGMEVAGYWLSRELIHSIDELEMADVGFAAGSSVLWADISPASIDGIPRTAKKFLSEWNLQRMHAEYVRLAGSQFWMGPEIEVVQELLEKTTGFMIDD